jgi:hypothetical protein
VTVDTITRQHPQTAFSPESASAPLNRGLERQLALSASALVSYPSPVHESQLWDEAITGAYRLKLGHQGETPNIFNVDLPLCPNPKKRAVIDDVTGEIDSVPHMWRDQAGNERVNRCSKNACAVCVVINAKRIAGAIQLAEPSWWFSLTLVGDSPSVINHRLALFVYYARKEVPSLQDAWAAEENPAWSGCHVHGYLHTAGERRISDEIFDDAVRRAGVGNHWAIDPVPNPHGVEYFGYPFKSLIAGDYMAHRFLDLNGSPNRRRLIHSSAGFWREGAGGRTTTRSQAEVIAFQRSRMRRRDQPRHHPDGL